MANTVTTERRASPRTTALGDTGMDRARLRPGRSARIVDLSSVGALIETDWRLLPGMRVELHHEKIHARDCNDCETTEGKIDHIDRVIFIEGDLSEQERARMLEIADRCPVHRTLHSEIKVHTRAG